MSGAKGIQPKVELDRTREALLQLGLAGGGESRRELTEAGLFLRVTPFMAAPQTRQVGDSIAGPGRPCYAQACRRPGEFTVKGRLSHVSDRITPCEP